MILLLKLFGKFSSEVHKIMKIFVEMKAIASSKSFISMDFFRLLLLDLFCLFFSSISNEKEFLQIADFICCGSSSF